MQSLQRTPFLTEEARQSRRRHRHIRRVPPSARCTAHRKHIRDCHVKHEEEVWIIDDDNRTGCPDLALAGQAQRPCARRGTRAVNPHGASVWHPSPKIRVSTVCPEAGKEAGHVAVSSLRKLSSGGTATPTAILLSSRRVSASLTTCQGSWLGPSPCAAASHGREGGARPLIDWLQMGTARVGRGETLPSQPLSVKASGLCTLPQVLRASLGPFGVPVVLVRPHGPRGDTCHHGTPPAIRGFAERQGPT